jgi:hypothetical protein
MIGNRRKIDLGFRRDRAKSDAGHAVRGKEALGDFEDAFADRLRLSRRGLALRRAPGLRRSGLRSRFYCARSPHA